MKGQGNEEREKNRKTEMYNLDVCKEYLDLLSKYDELPENDQQHIKQEIDRLHRATGKIPFD